MTLDQKPALSAVQVHLIEDHLAGHDGVVYAPDPSRTVALSNDPSTTTGSASSRGWLNFARSVMPVDRRRRWFEADQQLQRGRLGGVERRVQRYLDELEAGPLARAAGARGGTGAGGGLGA
jgi:hypothetical protein